MHSGLGGGFFFPLSFFGGILYSFYTLKLLTRNVSNKSVIILNKLNFFYKKISIFHYVFHITTADAGNRNADKQIREMESL